MRCLQNNVALILALVRESLPPTVNTTQPITHTDAAWVFCVVDLSLHYYDSALVCLAYFSGNLRTGLLPSRHA